MKSFNILLTCSSNKIHILDWIKKTSKKLNCKIKVIAGDSNYNVTSKYFCDIFWYMPKSNKKNYSKILNYCKKNNIKIIIPSSDKELIFWSTFKESLKRNKIYVMVSSKETVKTCLDKLNFYKNFKDLKSLVFTSQDLKDFKDNQKIIAKNRNGSGSNEIIVNKIKSNVKKYLPNNSKNYIFQNYIRSDNEVSIDCYFSNKNKLLKLVPRNRTLVNSGESIITTVIDDKYFFNEIKKLGDKLNFSGHVMFQCFVNKKNIHIFECNPRIGGASYMSFFNNMDSIYFFILENLFPKKVLKIKKNINIDSKLLIFKKTKFLR